MAEPLSAVAGVAGLLDLCIRVGKYLYDVKVGADRVDEEIEALSRQLEQIQAVAQSIQNIFGDDFEHATGTISKNRDGIQDLWEQIGKTVNSCRATLMQLFELIELIVGKESPNLLSKLDGLRRFLRKQSREEEFGTLKQQLSDYHHSLQTLLTSVNM